MDDRSYFLLLLITGPEDVTTVAVSVLASDVPEDFVKYFKEPEYADFREYITPPHLQGYPICGIDELACIYVL